MGRSIRRVPPNWQHPKTENPRTGKMEYQPLYDQSYKEAISKWIENHNLWLEGKHPDQKQFPDSAKQHKFYAEWDGNPPLIEDYRPDWSAEEATWYQVYETVSEGTPVTPPFETQDELIDYLSTRGTFWDDGNPWSREAAIKFVKDSGWLPSGIMVDGKFVDLTE